MKLVYGYTLIEVLVVVTLTAILAVATVNLFLTSVQGGSKAARLNEVRSSGDYALAQIERLVRNADTVTCVGGSPATQLDIVKNTTPPTTYTIQIDTSVTPNRIQLNAGLYLTASNIIASNLSFTCIAGTVFTPPKVGITFTLQRGETGARPSDVVRETFVTTTLLRTY
ncbi:hypothetical protein A3A66_02210 [Microgenomates group bacterium RIFCSPLOWO2_01_FULL_46_13]|nr:MAG: hypothetical protein A2783_01980 [Microgenomates group bacterium RIFCSPHIGHO2_01_FULL_45_11]OGV94790.1 MAG: hypothetical protein A3A66_02210 [Microgenomates group bacterium RIFCSPLOWO2_01_FULL_46_13]